MDWFFYSSGSSPFSGLHDHSKLSVSIYGQPNYAPWSLVQIPDLRLVSNLIWKTDGLLCGVHMFYLCLPAFSSEYLKKCEYKAEDDGC